MNTRDPAWTGGPNRSPATEGPSEAVWLAPVVRFTTTKLGCPFGSTIGTFGEPEPAGTMRLFVPLLTPAGRVTALPAPARVTGVSRRAVRSTAIGTPFALVITTLASTAPTRTGRPRPARATGTTDPVEGIG